MPSDTLLRQPWLDWAIELQSMAQCGLSYVKDPYDKERYERLRDIAAEMLACRTDIPLAKVKDLFCNETGYQTPKLDTRAAVFEDGRILLVQERDGLWALPGGWVDVTETIASNTVKEVREEAGLQVRAERLIALLDYARHNTPPHAYSICKAFVLCTALGGAFVPNTETIASGYFAPDALPPLALTKTTPAQVALCFRAQADPHWQPVFD